MSASLEPPLPGAPPDPVARLTNVFASAARSRTKTFTTALLSSVDRLLAPRLEGDAISAGRRSSGLKELSFAPAPPEPRPAADQGGRVGHQVAHEDVHEGVVVVDRQVVGDRLEDDEPPVVGDVRLVRVAVRPGAPRARRAADEAGRVGDQVAHEDVRGHVAVVGRQVVGVRLEHHEAPVAGDRRVLGGGAGGRGAVGARGAADEDGLVGRRVAHEDVPERVVVLGGDVVGVGVEGHLVAVRRDRGDDRVGVDRCPGRAGGARDEDDVVLGGQRGRGQRGRPAAARASENQRRSSASAAHHPTASIGHLRGWSGHPRASRP